MNPYTTIGSMPENSIVRLANGWLVRVVSHTVELKDKIPVHTIRVSFNPETQFDLPFDSPVEYVISPIELSMDYLQWKGSKGDLLVVPGEMAAVLSLLGGLLDELIQDPNAGEETHVPANILFALLTLAETLIPRPNTTDSAELGYIRNTLKGMVEK